MNKTTLTLALCLTAMTTTAVAEENTALQQARELSKTFMSRLKGELMQAMKTGGPEAAIEVCNTKAGPIAEQLERESGWKIGRTSLRLRNPNNAPDAWEKAGLEEFATRWQGKPLERYEWLNDGKRFRYMKSIAVQPPCLICHGENIAPAVAARLDALYPQDQARGYRAGELRGAFTLELTRP